MKILSIDASTISAGAAVIDEGKVLGEITTNTKITHSQKLMVVIDQLLNDLDIKIGQMDAIAVSVGPGSFTGVRIGMATAMGLARSKGIGLIGVSSLEGLANNVSHFDGLICPIQDARRNQIYTSFFRNEMREEEDLALDVDDFIELANKKNEKLLLVGPDAHLFYEHIKENVECEVVLVSDQHAYPRAASIGIVASKKEAKQSIKPNYVRKSQAERAYEEKHGESVL